MVYCCDYSANAIEVLRKRKEETLSKEDQMRIREFVCDITKEDVCEKGDVPKNGVDICTCVFVLSSAESRNGEKCHRKHRKRVENWRSGSMFSSRLRGW